MKIINTFPEAQRRETGEAWSIIPYPHIATIYLKEKFMGNIRLINFRMPVDAINRFDAICHANGRTRTSVLAELMTQYVLSEGPRQMAVQAHLNELDRHLENSRGKNVDPPSRGGFAQLEHVVI